MPRPRLSAEFVTSAVKAADLPRDGWPEIALVGRSNVGKSSLLNALVRTAVARTSSTPGKTRQVNVYRITSGGDLPFYVMDLPGYGHASGGARARAEFDSLISLYFEHRFGHDSHGPHSRERGHQAATNPVLCGVVLAIDARHPGLASDIRAWHWLASLDVPHLLMATKIDKLSQAERARLATTCRQEFGQAPLTVSALDGTGLDELWKQLRGLTE